MSFEVIPRDFDHMCVCSGGVLVLTGANPALGGTAGISDYLPPPHIHTYWFLCLGMIGYGMAKAAVHQLVSSLSQQNSGLPQDTTVLGILP